MSTTIKQIIIVLLLIIGAIGATVVMLQQQSTAEELTLDEPTPEPTPEPSAESVITETVPAIATQTPAPIVVFVSGEVHAPGVYTLPPQSRIVDAIQAAGGATENAALDALNQATLLSDGVQIHMSAEGEAPLPQAPAPAPAPASESAAGAAAGGTFSAPATSGDSLVRINHADSSSLQTLPGIGPAFADRIIEYRNTNGPFASLQQLKEVKGIGDKLIEKIQYLIVID